MKQILPFFLIVTFFIIPVTCKAARKVATLPIRVQMVLIKVTPHLEKGNFDKAVKILKGFKAKSSGPKDKTHNHPEINFVLGNCYIHKDQLKLARNHYKITLASNPDHRGAWQNLAKTEYDLDNHIAASKAFLQSYTLSDGKEPQLLYYAAVSLLFDNQLINSLALFKQLLTSHPKALTLEWKENLVYCLIQNEKNRESLPYIIDLTQRLTGKKQRRWREILLQQYLLLEMTQEAYLLVDSLTREEPTDPLWWKGLAHLQLQQEKYKKALSAMTIYSYLKPLNFEEEKLLGDLNLQQGIPLKAVANYEKCTIAKSDKQTILSLVRSYIDLGRIELALEKLMTLSEKQRDEEVKMLHGEILYTMKDFDQAASLYQQVGESQGKHHSRAFLMAGYSFWQVGEIINAKESFRMASHSTKSKKEAERALRQLQKHFK